MFYTLFEHSTIYSNYKEYTYKEDMINNWLAQSKNGYLKDFRKWIRENKRKIKEESIKDIKKKCENEEKDVPLDML